jgi:formylglycine-generating enzyme required for sulfatase activity
MLLVPAGPFTMGSDRGGEEDEHPAHTVTLPAFWLDRTEVTNAAYAACVAAGSCPHNASHLASTHHGKDEDFARPAQPVTGVTWQNARDYCAWRGARLPHEAEFEKAARGTDDRRFTWGNDPPTPAITVFGRTTNEGSPDDVGTHPAGRGPYGHDDLGGNVWEWMEDEYDPVAYSRATAPDGKPGSCDDIQKTLGDLRTKGRQGFTGSNPIPSTCEHVLRGGAYNYGAAGLRCTNRVHHPGGFRLLVAGFRCAKDVQR